MNKDWEKAVKILKKGGVGVVSTDTLYGLVGSAFSRKAVEKIYKIKKRNLKKPLIVLISSVNELERFGLQFSHKSEKITNAFKPKTSILFFCPQKKFEYLHRKTQKIAFRLIGPKYKNLQSLIKKVGPIVAPSANLEGEKPAETIFQAKKYFLKISPKQSLGIDFYINSGTKKSKPSLLIEIKKDKIKILRK